MVDSMDEDVGVAAYNSHPCKERIGIRKCWSRI